MVIRGVSGDDIHGGGGGEGDRGTVWREKTELNCFSLVSVSISAPLASSQRDFDDKLQQEKMWKIYILFFFML